MSDFDPLLGAPRSSKQAKMLGMAHDLDQPPLPTSPASINSNSGTRQSQDRSDRGSLNSATTQRKREPIEVSPPWGWPGSSDVSLVHSFSLPSPPADATST